MSFFLGADPSSLLSVGALMLLLLGVLGSAIARFKHDEWSSDTDVLAALAGIASLLGAGAALQARAIGVVIVLVLLAVAAFVLVERGARQRRTRTQRHKEKGNNA